MMPTALSRSPSSTSRRFGGVGSPLLILLIGLILTGIGTQYVARTTRDSSYQRFETLINQTDDAINQRVGTYVSLLSGASGIFAAKNDVVDRADFSAYVARLGTAMHDPGVIGLGFIRRVRPGEDAAVVAQMRAQGRPNFRVWQKTPAYPGNGDKALILFLEPELPTNQNGIGTDMLSEAVRHKALEDACDSGGPVTTPRVLPLRTASTGNAASFLIFMPVYTGGAVPTDVASRRQRLYGFVYCPFRSDNLLGDTLSKPANHLDVAIYDGTVMDAGSLLHQSAPQKGSGMPPPDFRAVHALNIAGRTWTAVYKPAANFEDGVMDYTPYVFIGGLAITALLVGIALSQTRARVAAEAAADRLRQTDAALRASEMRARRLIESNIIGVLRADFAGTVREANDALLHLTGLTPEEIATGNVKLATLTPPEAMRALERALQALRRGGTYPAFETSLLRSDGIRVPVLLGATRIEDIADTESGYASFDVAAGVVGDPDVEQFIAFLVDITARKDAERQLRESEQHQRAFFRDVLASVTEGRLRLCDSPADLPASIQPFTDSSVIVLTEPTLRVARQATRRASERAGLGTERALDMLTAVGEATMNAVMHGGGGTARVFDHEGMVQVWVEDQGGGIDMQQLPQATLERGYTTAGSLGHGFWMMLKTVDRLWLLTGPQGTTVVLEQDATPAEPVWLQKGGALTEP